MPFPTLTSLPANIKKLSLAKQKQWRAIWNSVFSKTGSEERAFRSANAIIKESLNMKTKLRELNYEVDLTEAMVDVQSDKKNGVLKEVVLLTGEKKTKNNTFYTKKALVEASTRYNGAKMFLDHGENNVRSVRDLGGVYRNVHLSDDATKVIGDLNVVENTEIRDLVFSMAKEKVGGLSIRDRGRGHEEGDIFMVEGFGGKNPFSIDLVTEPSANINLFENQNLEDENEGGENMKWSEITKTDFLKERPELVEEIRADEKKKVLSEVAEEIKNGKDAKVFLVKAEKLIVLSEAGLPTEVYKSVKKLIEQDGISLDMAKSIIENQKEVMKAINPTDAGKPKVRGHGVDRETVEGEEKTKLSKEDEDLALVESMT